MAVTKFWLTLAMTKSTWHRSMSTIEARDLAQAEGKATRALRALRLADTGGLSWDRWVIQIRKPTTGLPITVALGGHEGTTWTVRGTETEAHYGLR